MVMALQVLSTYPGLLGVSQLLRFGRFHTMNKLIKHTPPLQLALWHASLMIIVEMNPLNTHVRAC